MVDRRLQAYGAGGNKKQSTYLCYVYTGKNLLGLEVEDILQASSEADARERLAKQFVKVQSVREIPSQEYQQRFEVKKRGLTKKAKDVAQHSRSQREKDLDAGTVDPEAEVENFVDRFKDFLDNK